MKLFSFRRSALALFFIISVVPALTVSAIWYTLLGDTLNNATVTALGRVVLPVAALGLIPALIISIIFAELLASPVKRLNKALAEVARGNLSYRAKFSMGGEFAEIASALDIITGHMQASISQMKGEYEQIAAERNKLSAVLNSMTDGVFAIDSGGGVLLFNDAAKRLVGRSFEEVAGRPADIVIPLRDSNGHPAVDEWLSRQSGTTAQTESWQELELCRASEDCIWVNVQARVLTGDTTGIRALITFHDISEERQLEDMKVDFVALAAHELRTPLATVKGYLDILQQEVGTKMDAVHQSFLRRSIIGTNQLSSLVNNLLNVARIEHNTNIYHTEPTDWSAFVATAVKELQPRAHELRRKLTVSVPVKLPHLSIDVLSMGEVLTNLVDNAFKHTKDQGTISVHVEKVGNFVETTVADNGEGIPRSAIGKLFTKFYRVNGTEEGRGTGLGLYISKAIVAAHGGDIWVESKLGEGTTFGFRLPLPKAVADTHAKPHNDNEPTLRGVHGWIKEHSHR